jgi:uncharacterized OB-fold protein
VTEIVKGFVEPIRLEYRYTPGEAGSRFFKEVTENHRLVGEKCPECSKVYVPPRGFCPRDGARTEEEVEVTGAGTVTTFCIVNLPFAGQAVECPYVCASVLLDGADSELFHLIQEVPPEEVRMGMRVEPVWVDAGEDKPGLENIRYFRPSGEADVPTRHLQGRADA